MKENYNASKIVKSNKEFYKFLSKRGKTRNIDSINVFNDQVIEILYENIDTPQTKKKILSNEYVGIFTTSYGRLELLRYMNILQEKMLYADTDGFFFYGSELQTGNEMGDLKNEKPNSKITEFLALQPKSYAYKYLDKNENLKTIVRAKGFTLTKNNSEKLNLKSMLNLLEGTKSKIDLDDNINVKNKNTKIVKNLSRKKKFQI